jgi:hypothetical protein
MHYTTNTRDYFAIDCAINVKRNASQMMYFQSKLRFFANHRVRGRASRSYGLYDCLWTFFR